jgi:hypothetical protein
MVSEISSIITMTRKHGRVQADIVLEELRFLNLYQVSIFFFFTLRIPHPHPLLPKLGCPGTCSVD